MCPIEKKNIFTTGFYTKSTPCTVFWSMLLNLLLIATFAITECLDIPHAQVYCH